MIGSKYQLQELIGSGGMGVVWRACDMETGTPVAIKLASLDANRTRDDRLQREAQIEAQLAHPAIVRAFDFGRLEGGHAFLAMELLEGETLSELLEAQGPLSQDDAVRMLLPIADAISCAHRNGVVHLDLKPENIFVALDEERTQPKVLDFGIARVTADDALTTDSCGTVAGSPGYMSPEQAQGCDDLDHRADIWALCVVLYEAIAGRRAFPGNSYHTAVRATLQLDVPPLGLSDGAETLWPIIQRGLAKERDERFQSMRELGHALAGWLLAQGVTEDVCGTDIASTWKSQS